MAAFRRAVTMRPPAIPLGSGFTVMSACEEAVGPAGCHRAAPLGQLALLLTHGGSADSSADGMAFTHRPGRLAAVAEGVVYEERMPAGKLWHLSYLLLRGPWCDELNQALRGRPGAVLVLESPSATMRLALAQTVDLALRQPPAWAWQAQASIAALIGGLLTLAVEGEASLTAQVGRLIDHEPERTWRIAELAKRLGLARATLARRFVGESGEPPASWIRRRRIAHARRLLVQGLTVAEVAGRLGFANPYHFSRVFSAVAGMPPSHVGRAMRGARLHG